MTNPKFKIIVNSEQLKLKIDKKNQQKLSITSQTDHSKPHLSLVDKYVFYKQKVQ